MACQRSVPVRLDVGRPAGGIQGPGVVPARAAWRRSARCLDIPADGTSTRRRSAPHPETRWIVLALACPGGSVDGIGCRQPSHRATRLPIDTITTVGVPSRPVNDGCRALRCGGPHECSRCGRERVKASGPGCGSWLLRHRHVECPGAGYRAAPGSWKHRCGRGAPASRTTGP